VRASSRLLTAVAALVLSPISARADKSLAQHVPGAARTPACRYARMTAPSCFKELDRRRIAYRRVAHAPGVLIPVRLKGKLGGVLYRTDYPDDKRPTVPYEVLDCRLALALDDFSDILRAHDIDEVRLFSAWRPPSKKWPKGKIAKRHPGALAVDLRVFKKKSGEELSVVDDFHGRIGNTTCGSKAAEPKPATAEARELRSIVCEAADQHLFNVILTPDHDKPHHNHFHMEVTHGVEWFIVE